MPHLRTTSIASQDMLGIWEYIAQDNPAAADRMWERFEERFELLLKFPYTGESQERFRPGLRSIVEGSYVIFYEPRPDEVVIYRVLHGARQWENLI